MDPRDYGLPSRYTATRAVQDEMLNHALTCESRVCAIGAPPGCGKSVFALLLARILGGRTVILTANRGLQDQYYGDAVSMGAVDMRGRSNFRCWSGGTCEDGTRMGCSSGSECPYNIRFREWDKADIAISNYAWWLTAGRLRKMTMPDTLICDEAALAPDWISASLDFRISEHELGELIRFRRTPPLGEDIASWVAASVEIGALALAAVERYKAIAEDLRPGSGKERALKHVAEVASLANKAERIAFDLGSSAGNWVVERKDGEDEGRVWYFSCVWPGQYSSRLFRNIGRVILMSATLRRKTMALLGVSTVDYDFQEWRRQFSLAHGPVYWVPVGAIGRQMTEETRARWLKFHKDVCRWGADRKGLIQTTSFKRARQIEGYLGQSMYDTDYWGAFGYPNIFTNGAAHPDNTTAVQAYSRFRAAGPGSVLLSPSFSTGWDFPGKTAEWQILSKIPFPDTRSKVLQVRCAADCSYQNYIAAQELVQGSGRILRSDRDRGVTFLPDDNWKWFRKAASSFIPKFFSVQRIDELPEPLEKLDWE